MLRPSLLSGVPRRTVTFAGESSRIRRANTQADQDRLDEEKRRQAIDDLIQSWLDRLQLISVITTFFASTEAGLLSITAPDAGDEMTSLEAAANAGILGGMIMHTSAAVISFLGAFVLVRYKLHEIKEEESETLGDMQFTSNPISESPRAGEERSHAEGSTRLETGVSTQDGATSSTTSSGPSEQKIRSSNPHIIPVGPLLGEPPTHIIERCHALCIFISAMGFVLALMGITTFAWSRFSRSVHVVATACTAFCTVAGILAVVLPNRSGVNFTRQHNVPPKR